MSDFFEKLKTCAYKTKDEAVKIGKHVIDKANGAVNVAKLNYAINDTENKIKDIYAEVGKKLYMTRETGKLPEDEINKSFEKIDKLYEEIEALKEKSAELKSCVKCSECGNYNNPDSAFCSKCGAPVNADKDEAEDTEEIIEDEEEKTPETVKRVITIKAKRAENKDND